MQVLDWLVYPVNLTPHGYCLLWAPGLIWLHALSDAVIALAYFSIPLALAWFAHKRTDLQYRWVVLLFVCFILACGLTHVMAVYTLWVAAYGLEGVIKVVTALLSVATAALLWPLIPRLLALPSPAQLAAVNASLNETMREQDETYRRLVASEEQVRRANAELEVRVAARTADLTAANKRLQAALDEIKGVRAELEETVETRTAALKQRDLLLREVYHRVKNNLQVVDAVILMQANRLPDPASRAFLESLRSRIYALGLVHQQLMTSHDLKTFDLAPFLRELSDNLVVAGGSESIEVEVNAIPLTVDLDFAVPMGLIVTELVTNSFKHAFPEGRGKVSISVEKNSPVSGEDAEDGLIVTVSDNGVGTAGQDGGTGNAGAGNTGAGLGRTLIAGLLRQLGGRVIATPDAGPDDAAGKGAGQGLTTRFYLPQPRTT